MYDEAKEHEASQWTPEKVEAEGFSDDDVFFDVGLGPVWKRRAQSGVLIENYLTDPDRAVNICRKYVDVMYGESSIRRVK